MIVVIRDDSTTGKAQAVFGDWWTTLIYYCRVERCEWSGFGKVTFVTWFKYCRLQAGDMI